jgi:S-adenosylmethionine decarboxylase
MTGHGTLETISKHCMVELYDCPFDLLNDRDFITQSLREAVDHGNAELLGEVSHQFAPQGVTALGLLAESHISIHTWPEHGYAACDVFTCGERADAEAACLHLVDALRAGRHSMTKLTRGTGFAPGRAARSPIAEVSRTQCPASV